MSYADTLIERLNRPNDLIPVVLNGYGRKDAEGINSDETVYVKPLSGGDQVWIQEKASSAVVTAANTKFLIACLVRLARNKMGDRLFDDGEYDKMFAVQDLSKIGQWAVLLYNAASDTDVTDEDSEEEDRIGDVAKK